MTDFETVIYFIAFAAISVGAALEFGIGVACLVFGFTWLTGEAIRTLLRCKYDRYDNP